jgi:hypothetical protein
VKLSELAMAEPALEEELPDEGGDVFGEAATEALDLLEKGDKPGAVAALKGAIEACVADYMAEDSAEE